ncbi:histidinol-phosphate transaminase [Streptomyces fuscichromogenes]|nr:histidinol-phosphate transaminase [Streptomyces fuscichromogenes]
MALTGTRSVTAVLITGSSWFRPVPAAISNYERGAQLTRATSYPGGLFRKAIADAEPYVPGRTAVLLQQEHGIRGPVVKLSSNENPLGMSPAAERAIVEAAAAACGYPDDQSLGLRRKLAEELDVDIDNVLAGNGSSDVIYRLGAAMLELGDNVVMSKYSFNLLSIVTKMFGSELRAVEMDRYHHDLQAVLGAIDDRTKIVYVDLPNNPMGSDVADADFRRFVSRLPSHVLLVVDEAYLEFADPEYRHGTIDLIREGRNVMVVRTFSKSHGLAGVRAGYAVGLPEMIAGLAVAGLPFSVNTLAQAAAEAAVDDKDFLARTVELNRREREALCAHLDREGIAYVPSQTNFVAIDLGSRAGAVVRSLEQSGVIVRHLAGYGLENFIRVSLGTPEMNVRFIDALTRALGEPFSGIAAADVEVDAR